MMRMTFQDAIKKTPEHNIKIHLKDKQIEAISCLLIDVISASFAANVIQLASPVSGDGLEVNSYWSCTRPFIPHPCQFMEKSSLAMQDYIKCKICR